MQNLQSVEVAIAVIYSTQKDLKKILITRRPEKNVLGGYWEFPGGKIEPGENAQSCLEREVMEEVNLLVNVGQKLMTIEHQYEHAYVRLHCYACEYVEGELECLEVEEAIWIEPSELSTYSFPPANDVLIKQLKQQD